MFISPWSIREHAFLFYRQPLGLRVVSIRVNSFSSLISSTFLSLLRCPVFRRLREEAEKRKRPSWNELKGRKGDGELSGEAKHSTTSSRNPSRDQPEPGLINPAYEENEDGMELF